jgi:hypothetical protein
MGRMIYWLRNQRWERVEEELRGGKLLVTFFGYRPPCRYPEALAIVGREGIAGLQMPGLRRRSRTVRIGRR